MILFVTINIRVTFAFINFIICFNIKWNVYISFSSGSAGSQCTGIQLLVGISVTVLLEGLDKKNKNINLLVSILFSLIRKFIIVNNCHSWILQSLTFGKSDVKDLQYFCTLSQASLGFLFLFRAWHCLFKKNEVVM